MKRFMSVGPRSCFLSLSKTVGFNNRQLVLGPKTKQSFSAWLSRQHNLTMVIHELLRHKCHYE